MIKPTVAEEEFEVSQKPNIEDKTIQELLEMDPDMFPVIIVKSFSVPLFEYIKNELIVFIIQFLSYMMQPQGFKCTATISRPIQDNKWWFPACTKCKKIFTSNLHWIPLYIMWLYRLKV
jgi:hypothetical protein